MGIGECLDQRVIHPIERNLLETRGAAGADNPAEALKARRSVQAGGLAALLGTGGWCTTRRAVQAAVIDASNVTNTPDAQGNLGGRTLTVTA